MMTSLSASWRRLNEQLWFKPAWWGMVATITALLAAEAGRILPDDWVPEVSQETLQSLLTIIASSMLAVSTFSLSVLIQAFLSAASSASPRALRVIATDDDAQTAIAAFISAFIFSITALTALGIGIYGRAGRVVLLLLTIAVLIQVIVMLIRWIRTLTRLGRMGYTIERVEDAATQAMANFRAAPCMGGLEDPGLPATHGGWERSIKAGRTGYLVSVNMEALQDTADAVAGTVHLLVRPGAFVYQGQVIARLRGDAPALDAADAGTSAVARNRAGARSPDPFERDRQTRDPVAPETDDYCAAIRDALEIDVDRDFVQDPRFGLLVLAEIGQRALSPAVNDGGTAIVVSGAIARVLIDTWPRPAQADAAEVAGSAAAPDSTPPYPRIYLPRIDDAEFVRDGFAAIQRDAGGNVEVQTRVLKTLGAVAKATGGDIAVEARRLARRSWLLAEPQIVTEEDR